MKSNNKSCTFIKHTLCIIGIVLTCQCKCFSQTFINIKKSLDTIVCGNKINYNMFFNNLNKKSGIILGKSKIECEVIIENNKFILSPGNIKTKKMVIYTNMCNNDLAFNSKSMGKKDGMWVNFSKSNFVSSIDYYEMNQLVIKTSYRQNGSIKSVYRYSNSKVSKFGNWFYNRKGNIINHSSDF